MINDNNNHYSDVFGDEIKNHRRKKGKGKVTCFGILKIENYTGDKWHVK